MLGKSATLRSALPASPGDPTSHLEQNRPSRQQNINTSVNIYNAMATPQQNTNITRSFNISLIPAIEQDYKQSDR